MGEKLSEEGWAGRAGEGFVDLMGGGGAVRLWLHSERWVHELYVGIIILRIG